MSPDEFRERLANDESLLDALDDDQAGRILTWAERMMALGIDPERSDRLLSMIRRVNRAVDRGQAFDPLMTALESALPPHDAS